MGRKVWIVLAMVGLSACQPERSSEKPANEALEGPEANSLEAIAPEGAAVAPNPGPRSRFTSIDPAKCKLLEENIEEGGWSRRLCEGVAGYKLELTDSDLRQDIIVIPAKGQRSALGLTEIVANGAFNALGKTAEWRGPDPSSPDALIVRLGVAADPEGRKPDVSNLIVARLKPSACIVAVVPPGAGQNQRAQTIADDRLPECLKR